MTYKMESHDFFYSDEVITSFSSDLAKTYDTEVWKSHFQTRQVNTKSFFLRKQK